MLYKTALAEKKFRNRPRCANYTTNAVTVLANDKCSGINTSRKYKSNSPNTGAFPDTSNSGSAAPTPIKKQPFRIAFILLDNFSMIKFVSVLEPFEKANKFKKYGLFELHIISDSKIADSSHIISLNRHFLLQPPEASEKNFGCFFIIHPCNPTVISAQYESFESSRDSWLKLFLNHYPDTSVYDVSGEPDGDANTGYKRCRMLNVQKATLVSLALIQEQTDTEFASVIAEELGCNEFGSAKESTDVVANKNDYIRQPQLIEAISLMRANIEEPLPTDDIAFHIGISRRHMERLFARYIQTTPSGYYRKIRMSHAKQLLHESGHSILQISLACGFSSAAHFSTAYRNIFGIAPREERHKIQARKH